MNSSFFLPMMILLIAGIVLLGAEVFVPGAILGIMGVLAILGAVVMAFSISATFGFYIAGGVIILSGIGVALWIKLFPRCPIGRKMTLSKDGKDFKAADTRPDLVGHKGVAQSDLRPAGFAMIDGRRVDVVTDGGMISKGETVVVVKAAGSHVVVRKADA